MTPAERDPNRRCSLCDAQEDAWFEAWYFDREPSGENSDWRHDRGNWQAYPELRDVMLRAHRLLLEDWVQLGDYWYPREYVDELREENE